MTTEFKIEEVVSENQNHLTGEGGDVPLKTGSIARMQLVANANNHEVFFYCAVTPQVKLIEGSIAGNYVAFYQSWTDDFLAGRIIFKKNNSIVGGFPFTTQGIGIYQTGARFGTTLNRFPPRMKYTGTPRTAQIPQVCIHAQLGKIGFYNIVDGGQYIGLHNSINAEDSEQQIFSFPVITDADEIEIFVDSFFHVAGYRIFYGVKSNPALN